MNIKLKAQIEAAIEEVINENSESDLWEGWIHDGLIQQMSAAAELVFDSAMAASQFADDNQ